MSSPRKQTSVLPTLITLAIAGGAAALAAQFYQHPEETVSNFTRLGLLLRGVREETCGIDGFPIHYYCAGRRGTPLIFIHGLGGSAENWSRLIPSLSREYLVYALDLPGFGKTPLAPEGVNEARGNLLSSFPCPPLPNRRHPRDLFRQSSDAAQNRLTGCRLHGHTHPPNVGSCGGTVQGDGRTPPSP